MIKFFSSMQVGLGLIALIAISSIIATLNPQTTMYSTIWYRGLLILLSINLFVCTARRLPGLFQKLKTQITKEDLDNLRFNKAIKGKIDGGSLRKFEEYFKEQGFNWTTLSNKNKSLLIANKGKLDLLAPHIIHISILIIVIGAIIGNLGGKADIKCFINQTAPIPPKISAGYSLKLNDFKTLYDSDNAIDNWRSDFTLLKDGQVILDGSTQVNKPFKYKGMKFYQSAYGYNHNVNILMGGTEKPFSFPHNRPISITDNTFMLFSKHGQDMVLEVFQNRQLKETHTLSPNKELYPLEGIKMTYESLSPYSVIKVKTDPGLPLVMSGFLLMSLGFIFSWFGKYQEVRVALEHNKEIISFSVKTKNKFIKEKIYKELTNLI